MKDFIILSHFDEMDAESKYLTHKAKEAATHAYAPYSKFLVGAAVLLENGTVVTGTNQENAAYPSGMCAERVALYAAAALHPEQKITKLAVIAKRKAGKEMLPAPPCGSCRQVMLEFEWRQKKPIEIILQDATNKWVKAPSAESLLPFIFIKTQLDDREKK